MMDEPTVWIRSIRPPSGDTLLNSPKRRRIARLVAAAIGGAIGILSYAALAPFVGRALAISAFPIYYEVPLIGAIAFVCATLMWLWAAERPARAPAV